MFAPKKMPSPSSLLTASSATEEVWLPREKGNHKWEGKGSFQ